MVFFQHEKFLKEVRMDQYCKTVLSNIKVFFINQSGKAINFTSD
jgi:hypothetical protein